jgi:transcriptional antiterminator RfaH
MDNISDFRTRAAAADTPEARVAGTITPTTTAANTAQRWYVAQTQVHSELKASQHLARQGFDIYLPRYLKPRRHARRIDRVAAPLFPRYLFVSIDLATQRWYSIKSTIGVSTLITDGDRPLAVPDGVIEGLRAREDSSGWVQLDRRPRFNPGDKIRVRDGAFSDCLGLFEGISGEQRATILLELLGRKVRVLLDADIIDAA